MDYDDTETTMNTEGKQPLAGLTTLTLIFAFLTLSLKRTGMECDEGDTIVYMHIGASTHGTLPLNHAHCRCADYKKTRLPACYRKQCCWPGKTYFDEFVGESIYGIDRDFLE
jgi:hypothetical protein